MFDVIEVGGQSVVDHPLHQRRRLLKSVPPDLHPCIQIVEQTDDRHVAEDWLSLLPSLEGVVAKRWDGRYDQAAADGSKSSASAPQTASSSD